MKALVVNALAVRPRLACKCGTTLVVNPAVDVKPGIFLCPGCNEWWPGTERPPFSPARRLIEAVCKFQFEAAKVSDDPARQGYSVQFEVDVERR